MKIKFLMLALFLAGCTQPTSDDPLDSERVTMRIFMDECSTEYVSWETIGDETPAILLETMELANESPNQHWGQKIENAERKQLDAAYANAWAQENSGPAELPYLIEKSGKCYRVAYLIVA